MYYYKADEWKSEIHRPMTQLRHDVAKRFWAIPDLMILDLMFYETKIFWVRKEARLCYSLTSKKDRTMVLKFYKNVHT